MEITVTKVYVGERTRKLKGEYIVMTGREYRKFVFEKLNLLYKNEKLKNT